MSNGQGLHGDLYDSQNEIKEPLYFCLTALIMIRKRTKSTFHDPAFFLASGKCADRYPQKHPFFCQAFIITLVLIDRDANT